MTKTEMIKGPSCLTNAADDEPVFVLRANDELAEQMVIAWAHRYEKMKRLQNAFGEKQMQKYQDALSVATAMRMWREKRAGFEESE